MFAGGLYSNSATFMARNDAIIWVILWTRICASIIIVDAASHTDRLCAAKCLGRLYML